MSSHPWIKDFPECAGKSVFLMKGNRHAPLAPVSEFFSAASLAMAQLPIAISIGGDHAISA
jgi:hypothetical protein